MPTASEVAAGYVARHDHRGGRGPALDLGFSPLTVWEEWIVEEPERSWPVFLEIVRLRPEDDDVLEQVWYRLHTLLEHHFEGFHERVVALVHSNARLSRIAPAPQLEAAHYAPRYASLTGLASVWLQNNRAGIVAHELDRLVQERPADALCVALELIERGPLHGFTSYDVMSPLLGLLRQHGPEVIEALENVAAGSVGVRRVLWLMRRHQGNPPQEWDVSPAVWPRVVAAAGDTTEHNSDDPAGIATVLPDELERIVQAWFPYEETFRAWEEASDIVRRDAETGWELVQHLIEGADTDLTLECVAAGPLEDLVRTFPSELVDRIEQRAATDTWFRQGLAGVWISYEDVPREVADRYYWASGGELAILENLKEPWRGEEP